ncbi:MAG: peptidoglycan-binding domain-containing protein [Pseudomonadota bacterium]
MTFRAVTATGLAAALAFAPAPRAAADTGDFIGGAIVGGLAGAVIQKSVQDRRQREERAAEVARRQAERRVITTTAPKTTRASYRGGIPVTARGTQTQTALNYFGYNAGRVDGQIGRTTRSAIERYQAAMGYPVDGRAFQPYQFEFLSAAYDWAVAGGQAQTGLTGEPLLFAYRSQAQTGQLFGAAPLVDVLPSRQANAGLPNLFSGQATPASLATRCNAVMLEASNTGGYTTLASFEEGDRVLSEQFCLARGYAIAEGEALMRQISGHTPVEVRAQCGVIGDALAPQVAAAGLRPRSAVQADMEAFVLAAGVPQADLANTARVCLAVGYGGEDLSLAIGSALLLNTLGAPAYGELLGHHLREGFGTAARPDLARGWYEASLSAVEAGSERALLPGNAERPRLMRAALDDLGAAPRHGTVAAGVGRLPTFSLRD